MRTKIFLFLGTVISMLGINLTANVKCNGTCTSCNYSCMPGLFLFIVLFGKWAKKKLARGIK